MERKTKTTDISHLQELVELARAVSQSHQPQVLMAGDEELAVLAPVPAKRRARRQANPNAWLEPLIGAGSSNGPNDVSSNKHKYIADAVYQESHKAPQE
jgi:hypothetical protein